MLLHNSEVIKLGYFLARYGYGYSRIYIVAIGGGRTAQCSRQLN